MQMGSTASSAARGVAGGTVCGGRKSVRRLEWEGEWESNGEKIRATARVLNQASPPLPLAASFNDFFFSQLTANGNGGEM